MGLRAWAAWTRWPAAARWVVAYAALLGLCALVGLATPVGFGNAAFVAGAALILASLAFIRTGGSRRRVLVRDVKGTPIAMERVPSGERDVEIRRGVGLFLLGLGLWAPLVVVTLAR